MIARSTTIVNGSRQEPRDDTAVDDVRDLVETGQLQEWLTFAGRSELLAELLEVGVDRFRKTSHRWLLNAYNAWLTSPEARGICDAHARLSQGMSSVQLAAATCPEDWLIPGMLLRGRDTVIGAARKSLKTTLTAIFALHFATGLPLWGRKVAKSRVAFFSAESGSTALQTILMRWLESHASEMAELAEKELAKRVWHCQYELRNAGYPDAPEEWWWYFSTADLVDLSWKTHVPNLRRVADIAGLHRYLREEAIDICIIDPLYLAVPQANTASLTIMGDYLRRLSDVGAATGTTMIVVHHSQKSKGDDGDPLEFGDLHGAGIAEWMRQWILLSRRAGYDFGAPGQHKLWLMGGGSDGHSYLHGLDADEGLDGRPQSVILVQADEARRSDIAAEQAADSTSQSLRREAAFEIDSRKILETLARFSDGETNKVVRVEAGINSERFRVAVSRLIASGSVVKTEIRKGNRKKPYAGIRGIGTNGTHQRNKNNPTDT